MSQFVREMTAQLSSASVTGNLWAERAMSASISLSSPASSAQDYEKLLNKPKINGVVLSGDKSLAELGDIPLSNTEISEMIQTAKGLSNDG